MAAIGAGLGGTLAGCLSDGPGGTDTDRNGATDIPSGTGPPTADGGIAYEVYPFSTRLGRPAWRGEDDRSGYVELYATAAAARGALDVDELASDSRDELESVLAETDFDRERLLYVTSVGPSTCYDRIEVTEMSVDGASLVGAASAVDTSDPEEACGDAITFPSSLVRVAFDGDPLDHARISVTDGWGEETEVESTAIATDLRTLPGSVRPEEGPRSTPVGLECEEPGFERHGEGFPDRPPWGLTTDGWGAFAMRVDALTVERGDTVTLTMTNVGADEGHTGNEFKYNLQVRTAAGWQDVRGASDGGMLGYTDEALVHQPGEGFEWTLQMTEDGVLDGHVHEDRLTVCPGLPTGRYRFVFWEPSVAVAFDLVE